MKAADLIRLNGDVASDLRRRKRELSQANLGLPDDNAMIDQILADRGLADLDISRVPDKSTKPKQSRRRLPVAAREEQLS